MKYILLCLCITAHSALFGQPRLSVEYEMELKLEEVMPTLDSKFMKQFANVVAVYDYHFFNNASQYVFRESRKKDESITGPAKINPKSITIYKNFTDNVRYAQLDAEKDIVSMDSLATDQPWKIEHTATKIILGFSCQKATTTIDGQETTAWFAPEIPISDGPESFHGLPGMILQVENKAFAITAYKMENNDTAQWSIEMPTAEKYLSPQEFNERISLKKNECKD